MLAPTKSQLNGFSHSFVCLCYLFNQDACLNARNGSVGLQKHLRQTCTTTRTDAAVRTPTQTVTPDHDELDMSKALDHPETVKSSSQPSHFHSSEGNSLVRI